MMKYRSTTRKVIALLVGLSFVAAACGSDEPGPAASDATPNTESEPDAEASPGAASDELPYGLTPGKPYDGTELTFLICCETAAQFIGWRNSRVEFEELTGISVDFTDDPLGGLKDKIVTESVSSPGSFDVTILFDTWLPELSTFLEPASDEFLADVNLTDYPAATADLGAFDGTQYGIPVRSHVMGFYYRTDIFDDLGLTVPTTFEELLATAQTIDDADNGTAGLVFNWGKQSSISPLPWQQLLIAGGGQVFDDSDNPTAAAFNSPEGIAATQVYQDLLAVSPDGASAFNEADMRNSFASGDAAMTIAWSWSNEIFQNPELASADVIGNVGFTSAIPGAAATGNPLAMTWPIAIAKDSENKEAAAEWVKWMTNPDLDAKLITDKSVPAESTVVANRLSSLQSADANAANGDFSQAMADAYSAAVHQPIYADFTEVTEIIESMLSDIVAGGDVADALAKGESEVNAALAG